MSDSASQPKFHLVGNAVGWTVGQFPLLEQIPSVRHAVTTSRSLDVQMVRHDRPAAGRHVAGALGVSGAAWCNQVHGETVRLVDGPGPAGEGDALVTQEKDLALMAVSADCPLVIVADARGRAIGIAHASWRSTLRRITLRCVGRMREEFAAEPGDLFAAICPSAGPCCYEVGPEVRQAAREHLGPESEEFFLRRDERIYFDLWHANIAQLGQAGLAEDRIDACGICTICSGEVFPSHRRQGESAGRFAAAIALAD